MMSFDKWAKRNRTWLMRAVYAFQIVYAMLFVYVTYPFVRFALGQPLEISKVQLTVFACLFMLPIAYKIIGLPLAIVDSSRALDLAYLGESPSSAHRIDREAVIKSLAALETPDAEWWPVLREDVAEFLALPDGPKKWRKRASLLTQLYSDAERGAMPLATRIKLNELRRAINLEIDAP